MSRPRILFLDAYDSFSNNVVSLLTTQLGADVDVLHIDSPRFDQGSTKFRDDWGDELQYYDAVVCGPGPGSPANEEDVGLMRHIWDLRDDCLVPVLGICLGFQSLALSYGARIIKIPGGGLHGMIRNISFQNDLACDEGNIFANVAPFRATLYHSLCADVGQNSITESGWPTMKWRTQPVTSDLVPLAWAEETRNDSSERILMGIRHAKKPFWGLQYHPESICSETAGHQVVRNWFSLALDWNKKNGRVVAQRPPVSVSGPKSQSLLQQSTAHLPPRHEKPSGFSGLSGFAVGPQYTSLIIPLPSHVEVPDVVELLQQDEKNYIILDSASAHANRIGLDVRGRYSIIALDLDDSLLLEYHAGDRHAIARFPVLGVDGHASGQNIHLTEGQTVWHLLADFLEKRTLGLPNADSPFVGGFMGYISYELGLESIHVDFAGSRAHQRPDLSFAWVAKSIVIDHMEGTLRIQNLDSSIQQANEWVESIKITLQNASIWTDGLRLNNDKLKSTHHFTPPITPTGSINTANITSPQPYEYEAKVLACQDYITAGDSYELCLTDQTTITRTISQPTDTNTISANSWAPTSAIKNPSSWQLYRTLRTRQPAPFASYVRLGGATLISSSPERFLEYDRDGLCSMRPMKGTVRKSATCSTLEEAEKILHIVKEEAENLMIVDLVRHDLHSVCGPGNVQVPQLMKVEEYASVFQMISVVEGQLPSNSDGVEGQRYTGLDALASSLPPGSMTGAPKKRSCEILQEIERQQERSLYSGVVGYMDVTGKGDWSVTIRSLVRWDDETVRNVDGSEAEVWRIGAGGAVTALSTAEGEREEMFTKLKGPLGVFEDQS